MSFKFSFASNKTICDFVEETRYREPLEADKDSSPVGDDRFNPHPNHEFCPKDTPYN